MKPSSSKQRRNHLRLLVRGVVAALSGVVLVGGVASCDRTVTPTEALQPLQPVSLDADAGTWRMLVMTSPTQVAVPAPAATTSPAYAAELAAIKTAQANITDGQRRAVRYWSAGGVMRWNQITRGLVARFNLPPAPRADGTYPAPDAENPFSDPVFPFANPPYAARAYSYLSVAQYEALKAAWHYKHLYDRPAPTAVDAGVKALVPVSDLPAYPSEDAVISGVTAEMLKLLFPTAVEEITKLAAEERTAALLSGRATASDIAQGLALGKAVANLVIARARTDGIGTAGGSLAMAQAFADTAVAHGEIPWKSQELPTRPPLLMNYGTVKAWTLSPDSLAALDPPPPPSTSSQQFRDEVAEVKRTVANLSRAQLAIAFKWNDGAGTYTPPGHWNDIATEYIAEARMSEVRAARAYAYLNMAMHDASVACWRVKFKHFNPRPAQIDASIKTQIGLPNFPAFPSGHSTFSMAAATVLGHLFPSSASAFEDMADEAGVSRLYGGIHYRSDIVQGTAHGKRLGDHVVGVARGDGGEGLPAGGLAAFFER
jgi:membrane-associated phospholipid phosphatase